MVAPPSFFKLDASILFVSVWIILSVWAGYFWKITPLIILASLLIVFIFIRKKIITNRVSDVIAKNNPHALLIAGYILLLAGIFFGVQGGFDLSADTAPSFAAERIHETIPATYDPFFHVPFFYPPGLPAIVSQLLGMGIPSYVWMWIFGVLGLVLLAFYSSRLAGVLGVPSATWLIPILIIGLRFPLQSLLTGEYPVLFGYGIGLAAVWWGQKRWELFALGAGAATLLHPYAGVTTFILGWVFHRWNISAALRNGIAVAVVAFPMLYFQFLSVFASSPSQPGGSFSFTQLITTPFTIGIVSVLVLAALAIFLYTRKTKMTLFVKEESRPWILILIGLAGVVVSTFFPSFVFGGKIILLAGLGVTWGVGLLVKRAHFTIPEWKLAVGLLLVILIANAGAGTIHKLVGGSKVTHEEASFAEWFSTHYDVDGTKVLFLSSGHSKMAQYAHTIPFDALESHFLTSVIYVFATDETKRIQDRSHAFQKMLSEKCISCALAYDAKYIVVNIREFPTLPRTILYEKDGFIVYAGTTSLS